MTSAIDPSEAIKVFEAFESGRLDNLFTAANTEYFDHEGFQALRFGVGVQREAVWRLISAIRRSTGLLVLESAWGDFQVHVTPTAQLMEALYEIDTWAARSLVGRTELPADEEWIVQDRLLVEEAVMIAMDRTGNREGDKAAIRLARAEVIASLYDEVTPSSETGIVACRFYHAMRELPDARSQSLTPDYIMGIHRLLSGDEPGAGLVRTTERPAPTPDSPPVSTPPARILGELQSLHAYTESQDIPFVHPLIKTLALAWWLRRIRPFEQHNYLMSRLVSMAYALRHGYQVAGIVGFPGRLDEHLEDSGDLTAVFINQLRVIHESKQLADANLRERIARFHEVTTRFAPLNINHRQALILDRALRSPTTPFTIKHHARTRELAYETARQDFIRLVDAGYLQQRTRGKAFEFSLAPDAAKRIAKKLS